MKVLFACGGTAGHINPALAVADTLRQHDPDIGILFVGNPNRMEAKLVPQGGYDFTPLLVEGFHRSFMPKSIMHNLRSIYYLATSGRSVKDILQRFQPDIVMGTGGYVSGPVLRMASKMGYKTITHESNAFPGATTRLLSGYVDKVLLAVEDTKEYLPEDKEYIVTGNPVLPEILTADRFNARKTLGVEGRVCILSYGGSNGAERINQSMAEVIARLLPSGHVHHIHATGRFGVESFPEQLKKLGISPEALHLDIREYIDDMAECLAAADLVICRAGAMTLSELQAVGRASILIPSPNVTANHQYYNAKVLANHNAAIILEEKDLTGERLGDLIRELVSDPQELENIARNAYQLGIVDGAENICQEIYSLYEKDKSSR